MKQYGARTTAAVAAVLIAFLAADTFAQAKIPVTFTLKDGTTVDLQLEEGQYCPKALGKFVAAITGDILTLQR